MRGLRRALVKVIVLVPITLIAAALAIGPGGLVSNTPATRLGVHAMMAFWVSIPVALSVLSYQRRKLRVNVLIMTALVFPMIVHIGSAVRNRLIMPEPIVERTYFDSFADFFEMTMFAILLASAVICMMLSPNEEPPKSNLFYLGVALILPLALFGASWFLFSTVMTLEMLNVLGWVLGSIIFVSFSLIFILVPRIRNHGALFDTGYMTSALLLFSISVISLLFNLHEPTLNWEFAETVQMAGCVLLALALGVPFLKAAGFRRRFAYTIIIGLILMAYFPFLLTIAIETMPTLFPLGPPNVLAYTIIHLGAASLSAMMAILLYIYPKKIASWTQYPMIGIFGMWSGIAVVQVILLIFPEVAPLGEPITPYNVGSLLTLGLLYLTIRWTKQHPTNLGETPSAFKMTLFIAGLISLALAGEGINQLVLTSNPDLSGNPMSNVIILVTNLFIMFAFAYIIFLLSEGSGGEAPVELYVVLFLAMWILPNILRSYYTLWTPGWWISEILLFAGLLAGTPLFTWLYVRTMHEVEDSHRRANMFADLLMHDISNYNQMMMMSLELLGSEDISENQRKRVADDGRQVISFSEQLISNVRLLSEADKLQIKDLQPMNLVNNIVSALDIFTRRVGTGELIVNFQSEDSKAEVMANELLVHIFLNILYSALECRARGETVTIGIQEMEKAGEAFWQIIIKAPGRKIDDENEYSSGTLGLLAAELMTKSLDGQFSVDNYTRTDVCEGRLFSILLHAANF